MNVRGDPAVRTKKPKGADRGLIVRPFGPGPAQASVGVKKRVADSAVPVLLQAANIDRVLLVVVNDSASDMYIGVGALAVLSATVFSYALPGHAAGVPRSTVEIQFTGPVWGLWDAATVAGGACVTEET